MMNNFERTRLWDIHLAVKLPEKNSVSIERLRNAFRTMRERTSLLINRISHDCNGLTLHDVSHLDALWEMADIIVGESYEFTPAEIFVLGAAILLHDAGMTLAAYPGGREQITSSTEWKDNFQTILRRESACNQPCLTGKISEQLEQQAMFATLRDLHASAAEQLATQAWQTPDGSSLFLLEDEGLRSAYGATIGRIAHSHHWDPERLIDSFNTAVGAAVGLPGSWTVNEAKIAFILRCADAAHLDSRRAPSYLFAITDLKGISKQHWIFQNKINQPTLQGNKLVYTSGSDFFLPDVSSWWCAYDAITLVHRELEKANSLLPEVNAPVFAAHNVAGAENPRSLARYIRPNGWEPVNSDIRASDPISLAKTLGGRNLYGNSPVPVFRELLQNSSDAIRARRQLEYRDANWGKISITIEDCVPKDDHYAWLHVDDNGIGMSQNVLTGPLIDFGKSIWNSNMLREEFPGLAGANIAPIGKFGIGFFSVFMLGDLIKVASKRYDAGIEAIKVLEFDGLARPVLRKGMRSDLPVDYSTRISLRIPHSALCIKMLSDDSKQKLRYSRYRQSILPIIEQLQSLISALDIEVLYENRVTNEKFRHDSQWIDSDPSVFLQNVYGKTVSSEADVLESCYAKMLRKVVDSSGKIIGRAALHLNLKSNIFVPAKVAVGGFVCDASDVPVRYVGVFNGECNNVSRNIASFSITKEVLNIWLREQAYLISTINLHITTRIAAGQSLFRAGIRDNHIPVCFFANKLRTFGELMDHLKSLNRVMLPLRSTYSDNFEVIGIDNLKYDYATLEMRSEIIFLSINKISLFSEEHAKMRYSLQNDAVELDELKDDDSLMLAFDILREARGQEFTLRMINECEFTNDFPGFSSIRKMLELTFTNIESGLSS